MVALIYHPYRFDGRVETALRGGLCLCWGVAIDYQHCTWTASISTAALSRTGRQDQGVPPALTGSAYRFRLPRRAPFKGLYGRGFESLYAHSFIRAGPAQIRTG